MPVRCLLLAAGLGDDLAGVRELARRAGARAGLRVGVVVEGSASRLDVVAPSGAGDPFWLPVETLGLAFDDPALHAVASAAAGCFPRDVAVVVPEGSPLAGPLHDGAAAAGCAIVTVGRGGAAEAAAQIDAELDRLADEQADAAVGVGPHPRPWPTDLHLDPALLAAGDRRNVVDRYRYWSEAAIRDDLRTRARPFHVAIENWQHDLNIGTVVRNANAFGAAGVHIVGRRRWNRRGAMATDRYLAVHHHDDAAALVRWAGQQGLVVVGFDTGSRSAPLAPGGLPERCVLVFGQEGPGLSVEMAAHCEAIWEIPQVGSTRSLNAGVASGIAMYAWTLAHDG